jgi:hypothetical protein
MKRKLLTLSILLAITFGTTAQVTVCPGGGDNFVDAVSWDPNWIVGCSNGTSCNGTPTKFDDRTTCQANTTMDACAPAPTCTVDPNGSDLWYKFTSVSATANLVVNPSVSWILGVQVFSGGPACGGLTQIACAYGAGPSSLVSVPLSGLIPGNTYYYRIFGSASNASQRTGVFCFCGTTGLTTAPLAFNLASFSAAAQNRIVTLRWSTSPGDDTRTFDIERSIDNVNFTHIATVNAVGSSYIFNDQPSVNKVILYRIKATGQSGHTEYSKIVAVNLGGKASFSLRSNMISSNLTIDATENIAVKIINATGTVISSQQLKQGFNQVDVSTLPNGVYFVRSEQTGDMMKFIVGK